MYRMLAGTVIIAGSIVGGLVGSIHHLGDPDEYIVVQGHPVQLEYLPCVFEQHVVWYEDGSPRFCTVIGQAGR